MVEPESRNGVLTLRNRALFAVGIVTPLACGMVMSGAVSSMRMYQVFFLISAGAALCQAAVVSAIHPPLRQVAASKFSAQELTGAIKTLAHSKPFLLFIVPMLLFHASWQIDWSMWYIGQVQYLHLTQAQMTTFSGIFNIGQLIAIGVLSGIVRKKGTDRTLPYAALGLMFCPLTMMICLQFPEGMRMLPFTLMVTILNAPSVPQTCALSRFFCV